MRVIVTDGDNRAALAITRSLGKKGHEVFVGEKSGASLASASRHCAAGFSYPDPASDPAGFVRAVTEEARARGAEVVLPVSDITTMLVSEHRGMFEERCAVPFPPAGTLALAAGKDKLMEAARALGIPVPRTAAAASPGQARDLAALGLGFPVVIKPHRSRIQGPDGRWISASVSYASNQEELEAALGEKEGQFPLLLQERINGPGIGVFACCERGAVKAVFSHRRLREKPPSGGVSVLRESIPVPADVGEYAGKLLAHLGWHGVAMVEFKRDDRDGTHRLMEVNGRFWGSLQLAIDAGVDFPALLVDMAAGRGVPACAGYKTGVRTRWLWGDIDALLMLLFKGRKGLHLPPGHRGRLASVAAFLKSFFDGTRNEVLRLEDIRPWLYETSRWFASQLGFAGGRH